VLEWRALSQRFINGSIKFSICSYSGYYKFKYDVEEYEFEYGSDT